MGHIFCIIGKSSSGKDTIYKRLVEDKDLGLEEIVSYTTRPIRVNEVEGKEYHFVDGAKRDELIASGKVIEIRSYNTCHGVWDYFTVADDSIDYEKKDYIIIGTVESFAKLKDFYEEGIVVPIYIEVEDGERLARALSRERSQKEPKFEEMCRRFLADSKDFSEEKLKQAGIEKRFVNDRTIDELLEQVRDYIQSR